MVTDCSRGFRRYLGTESEVESRLAGRLAAHNADENSHPGVWCPQLASWAPVEVSPGLHSRL